MSGERSRAGEGANCFQMGACTGMYGMSDREVKSYCVCRKTGNQLMKEARSRIGAVSSIK